MEFSSQRGKTLLSWPPTWPPWRHLQTSNTLFLFSAAGIKPVTGFIKSFTNVFSWTNPAASFLMFLVSVSQQHFQNSKDEVIIVFSNMNFLEFLGIPQFVIIFSFLLYFRFTCTLFGMATFSPSFCLLWFGSCLSIISTLSKFICTIIVFLFSVWTNCWTLASVLLISLELLSFLREDNVFYPDSYTRSIYSGWTFMNSQFANHPSSETFLYFARFFRTRERPCMNRVRSLLSMRDMFLGYSFPARPYNRVFGRVSSFMTTGLSINGISWSGKKNRLTRENKID